ncbi:MAG: diaminopimelate epimerase [Dehalococcoidia bacterium]|nr:MAG: diaminopimelate epimerase [Dehalococcoidia bacterium]
MNFTKLQGAGNDFVLIDARKLELDWAPLARDICHRHFGVGADGLLLVLPARTADLRLRMFNPDGSEAEACGNGLRCFAKYVRVNNIIAHDEFTVETMVGTRMVMIQSNDMIQVEMGVPVFDPASIPVIVEPQDEYDMLPVLDYPIEVDGTELTVSFVSMGNPHAVCFLSEPVAGFPLTQIGPLVENHRMFPNRVNFEVANIIDRNEIQARVWERGAGETLACGSGACAIAVTARLKDLSDNPVNIIVPGGTLNIEWNGAGEVFLSGPAELVFYGVWKD